MLRVENTERFIREFRHFRQEISKIDNPVAKHRAEKLLVELEVQCKLISEAHNPSNSKAIDPRTARDSIKKSVNLRRQLGQLIKDSKA